MGSLSQVNVPELDTFTNLYVTACPGVIFKVIFHTGLLEVYCEAESAGALEGSQVPNCSLLPAILIVSPGTVTTRSVNDTATAVGQAVPLVLRTKVEDVARVVGVADVVAPMEASRTMGSPLTTLIQAWPLPSEVTVAPLPYTLVHRPFGF